MATLHVSMAPLKNRATTGGTMPISAGAGATAETETTSSSSALLDLVGVGASAWVVTAVDADHYVNFGTAAITAGPNLGYLVLTGTTREFGAESGQRMAARTV